MDIQSYMHGVGRAARAASRAMARADTAAKDRALHAIAAAIERDRVRLLEPGHEIRERVVVPARRSGIVLILHALAPVPGRP